MADINELITSRTPEGEQIEFKEGLSSTRQGHEPWSDGKNKISDRARDKILEEVVAFANAHGGALLLGIGESTTKPSVAANISPVPQCVELADRLKMVFRDCVEPQLPQIEIFAVPTQGQSGVVLLRTIRSRLAPHRIKTTRVCPIRRSDRCEEMTMREIQDTTLNLARGLERLNQQLKERATLFAREFERLETPGKAFGIRLTAVPIGDDVWLSRVYRKHGLAKELTKPPFEVFRRSNGERATQLKGMRSIHSLSPYRWHLQLRAARAEAFHPSSNQNRSQASNSDRERSLSRNAYWEIHCNGMIELGFVSSAQAHLTGQTVFLNLNIDVPIVMCADIAVWADHLRTRAGVPSAEYAVDAEIRVFGENLEVSGESPYSFGSLEPGRITFPKYSLGALDDIPSLLASFEYDFYSTFGHDISETQGVLEVVYA